MSASTDGSLLRRWSPSQTMSKAPQLRWLGAVEMQFLSREEQKDSLQWEVDWSANKVKKSPQCVYKPVSAQAPWRQAFLTENIVT